MTGYDAINDTMGNKATYLDWACEKVSRGQYLVYMLLDLPFFCFNSTYSMTNVQLSHP